MFRKWQRHDVEMVFVLWLERVYTLLGKVAASQGIRALP